MRRRDPLLGVDFVILLCMFAFVSWWAVREFKTSPPYVDPVLYPVRGIDVSAHNGMMNLDAARASGIEFVFIKASEGVDFRDANFRLNYDKAMHAGMKVGAYHFFRFDTDGVDQAVNFIEAIGGRTLSLGVAIDVETHGNTALADRERMLENLSAMAEYLRLAGYTVTFYSSLKEYYSLMESDFRGCPMWLCSFRELPGDIDCRFWQYYHRGKVAGVKGNVDLDVFCGSREDFERFCAENERRTIQYVRRSGVK